MVNRDNGSVSAMVVRSECSHDGLSAHALVGKRI